MAIFTLSGPQASLLSQILTIGFEGAGDVDHGTEEDRAAIAALMDELEAIPSHVGVEITVMSDNAACELPTGPRKPWHLPSYPIMTDRAEREHERRSLGGES